MSFKYPFLTEPLYLLPAEARAVFYSLLEIINIILKTWFHFQRQRVSRLSDPRRSFDELQRQRRGGGVRLQGEHLRRDQRQAGGGAEQRPRQGVAEVLELQRGDRGHWGRHQVKVPEGAGGGHQAQQPQPRRRLREVLPSQVKQSSVELPTNLREDFAITQSPCWKSPLELLHLRINTGSKTREVLWGNCEIFANLPFQHY